MKMTAIQPVWTTFAVLGLFHVSFSAPKAYASDWSELASHPLLPPATASAQLDSILHPDSVPLPLPTYQKIFDAVDRTHLLTVLREMTGYLPVKVNGTTFQITNRYAPASKAQFRAYFKQYFQELGISTQEMSYNTKHRAGETQGHDLEAVLPGKSKDSVVIIVHYDSIGKRGQETANPGVDDDMTGMAIMLETAKLLAPYAGTLQHTIRFVAADYEEWAFPGLEGARFYAKYLKDLSVSQSFRILAAVDNEQSGWNCAKDRRCGDSSIGDTFDVFSCSGDSKNFNFKQIGDDLQKVAQTYSKLKVTRDCISENSDHYAMWEIGVPAVVFSEHRPFNNDHFDQRGRDTFDKIDQDYFFSIAQVGVTFAATLAGAE